MGLKKQFFMSILIVLNVLFFILTKNYFSIFTSIAILLSVNLFIMFLFQKFNILD